MTKLSINLNKIALIRNARDTLQPDPCEFALSVLRYGAHGVTVHPRPDQRHIRAQDCTALRQVVSQELNVEGNPFAGATPSSRGGVEDYPGFMALVERSCPDQVTLVPDADAQLTSDHGFDIARDGERLAPVISQLREWGMRVSLFMDPDPEQIALAAQTGAHRIELYTEHYARAHAQGDFAGALAQYQKAAACARQHGLEVNAGHDLNLANLPDFRIEGLEEVSIGHAFTIDALRFGLQSAVERYLAALQAAAAG